jgi:ribonuclease D
MMVVEIWIRKPVLKYIKEICEDESIQKVFHNAQYDIGWLSVLGY